MLLLDGASLDFISPAVADGRLPNIARILDGGAVMHLATLRPTQPAPVLTAIATGKLPMHTGVRSAALYRVRPAGPTLEMLPDYCFAHGLVAAGLLDEAPQTSASLRARPLWAILSASGIAAAVVRWPLTYPPLPLRGDMVTRSPARAAWRWRQSTFPPELVDQAAHRSRTARTSPRPPRRSPRPAPTRTRAARRSRSIACTAARSTRVRDDADARLVAHALRRSRHRRP